MSQEEIVVPKGWELKTIEEICNKITDGEHLKPKTVSEGVPFVSAKDLKDEGVDFNHVLYVDKTDAEIFRKKCNPEKNDILIGSRGSIGKICLVNTEQIFCLLGSVILLKPLLTIESKFITYFFKSGQAQNQLLNASGHSVVKALYLRDIKKLKISVPEKQIQKQIVAKLDHILGELDTKKKQIISLIEQNKERIDFFEKNWMSYVIDREIEKHPQRNEWELTTIGDEVEFAYGKGLPKPERIEGDYPVYGSNGIVGTHHEFLIDFPSIVIGRKGTVGALHLTKTKFWPTDVSFYTKIINPKKLDLDFLYYLLSHIKLEKIKQSGPKSGLNRNDAYKISISLPDPQIQKQIIQNIKNAEQKFQTQKKQFENIKNNYESKINYINHIQSSILDSAFSGKLVQ